MKDGSISIAIIGGGFGRRLLLPVACQLPQFSVRRLITSTSFPEDLPAGVILSHDLDDALCDPDVQAVLIATPHALHAGQVAAFLGEGKHVLCEKPLALRYKDALGLTMLADWFGLVGAVDYSFRYIPERAWLRALVEQGAVGKLTDLHLSFTRDDFARWPASWYYRPDMGGGALNATGPHLIDAAIWLSGSQVASLEATMTLKDGIDTAFSVELAMESGCAVTLDVSHSREGAGKHQILVRGSQGLLTLDALSTVPEDFQSAGKGWSGSPRQFPTACVLQAFAEQIINPVAGFDLSFQATINRELVREAILLSHRKRCQIDISQLHEELVAREETR